MHVIHIMDKSAVGLRGRSQSTKQLIPASFSCILTPKTASIYKILMWSFGRDENILGYSKHGQRSNDPVVKKPYTSSFMALHHYTPTSDYHQSPVILKRLTFSIYRCTHHASFPLEGMHLLHASTSPKCDNASKNYSVGFCERDTSCALSYIASDHPFLICQSFSYDDFLSGILQRHSFCRFISTI